jgi:hypothetical protein
MTRVALASLIALVGFAPAAFAQAPAAPPPAAPPPAAVPSPPTPPPAPAPGAQSAPASAPAAAPAAPASPEATPPAPPAPPPPPEPPTDPAAIRLLSTLETVCIPAAAGQGLAGLAKTAGYRKSGDNFVLKQTGYQFTILAQGSNPNQCHVDIVHPIDVESPGKPLIIALHNWAVFGHDWTLYRNDKNVSGSSEFTTRSWENRGTDKNEAVVLTTIRKADGSPSRRDADTSEMIYSVTKPTG